MKSIKKTCSICVFCSSQSPNNKAFLKTAYSLGKELSNKGHTIIYGGGETGMMGSLSRGVLENQGHLIEVIPNYFNSKNTSKKKLSKVITTKSFSQRKNIMISKSDLFICLPGGFGTMDELFEVIALNQLSVIKKNIVLIDINNFWDTFKKFLNELKKKGFLYDIKKSNIYFKESIEQTIQFIEKISINKE
tara:strand:- start:107 stop:679 length:573 start_codon:yes stop_codon:yes gene_type:complete